MLSLQFLSALLLFCVVGSVTPGPNNLMVMASGMNFGYRRSFGHMLGVAVGFAAMVVLVGLGLMRVFELFPVLRQALLVACVVYLLWLAWKIANAAPPSTAETEVSHPMSFLQAASFQWVNPKGWTMALSTITLFAPDRSLGQVALIGLIYALITLPCLSLWVLAGQTMRQLLDRPWMLRAFNWTMAVLLVASLYPVLRA
ncbi:LysE family translocator [Pseudooceanicola sp. CBS1P-1]|uniref:LysE family transporter n=1 Tax=Pseudooceanicola albus TaxID=2692189 RepID=A0A6L7G860_9RHOB|nr:MULTISPECIES: LysE family translocator [Pseudooceanicola]MBT9386428.1 LysE family translocator [Pseudooceanicola endophyticus]MXN20414.1 LysE family transporter [Pseudooceanicola albus]